MPCWKAVETLRDGTWLEEEFYQCAMKGIFGFRSLLPTLLPGRMAPVMTFCLTSVPQH